MANFAGQLLQEGGQHGVQSIAKVIGVFLLFVTTNLLLFGFLIYKSGVGGGLFAALFGFLFTIYATYRAYSVVKINTAKFVYTHATPLFQRICTRIIERATLLYDTNAGTVEQVVALPTMLDEQFGNRCPRLIHKGVSLLLSRIPVTEILGSMKQNIASVDKDQAGRMLFERIDDYIQSIFERYSMKYVFWLLPVNVLLLLGIGIVF